MALQQPGDVAAVEERTRDEEVEERGQTEECRDTPGDADIEQRDRIGRGSPRGTST